MSNWKPIAVLVLAVTFGLSPLVTSPFGGYAPTQFPVQIPRPAIQPAGYAFSIWGLIYLWLMTHAVFGLLRRAADPAWDRVRLPLILSLAVGTVWLWIAARDPVWATVAILVMLGGALVAAIRCRKGPDRWLLAAPLAIYAGWLTAASGVSVGVIAAGYGWLSDTAAALVMLAVVLALAVAMQWRLRRVPEYGLTVVWALVAVALANIDQNRTVTVTSAAGAAIMLALAVLAIRSARRARMAR